MTGHFNYTNSSIPDSPYTARFWCNDTSNNINDTESVGFSVDTTSPIITLVSPLEGYEDVDGNITFTCNATDDIGLVNITLWTNISGTWMANETKTITGTSDSESYSLYNINNGTYIWNCETYDNNGNSDFAVNRTFSIVEPVQPNATEFNVTYGSTNLSAIPDLNNVTNLTLAAEKGKIQFPADYGVDANNQDYDTNIEIGDSFISVNTSALNPTFNASANLTMNVPGCPAKIYYGEGVYASSQDIIAEGNVCNASSDPSCTNVNCSNNTVTFTVSHFTGFASGVTANLTVWDENDTGVPYGNQAKYVGDDVKFFANYTNSTDPIQGASCSINFSDSSGSMSYNSSGFYEYTRSFIFNQNYDWNATCSKTGYDILTAIDNITIGAQSYGYSISCPGCFILCGSLSDMIDGNWNTKACGGIANAKISITPPANVVSGNFTFKYDNSLALPHHVSFNCYDYSSSSWTNFYTPTANGVFITTTSMPSGCLSNPVQIEVILQNVNSIFYEGYVSFGTAAPPPPPTGGAAAPVAPPCYENWNCSAWSGCSPEEIEICLSWTDLNNCGTATYRPDYADRSCIYTPPAEELEIEVVEVQSTRGSRRRTLEEEAEIEIVEDLITLEDGSLVISATNTRDTPIFDATANVVTPDIVDTTSVYTGLAGSLFGFDTRESIMRTRLLKWNITPQYFERIEPGETIQTNFSVKTPITNYNQTTLNLIITEAGRIISNKTVNINIDVPEFLVITDMETKGILDLYIIMNNKENRDREFDVEFTLNKVSGLSKTLIGEYYGPYPIKADDIVIAAYKYTFSEELAGANYSSRALLYENGKVIVDSLEIIDLTAIPRIEKPSIITSTLKTTLMIIFALIVLTMIFTHLYEREFVHKGIHRYKTKKASFKRARTIRKNIKEEIKRLERARKRKLELKKLRKREEGTRREEAKKRAEESRKKEEKEAERRRESARRKREELKRTEEKEKKRRKEAAGKAAKSRRKRIKEAISNKVKAARLRAKKAREERKLMLERLEKARTKKGELKKIREWEETKRKKLAIIMSRWEQKLSEERKKHEIKHREKRKVLEEKKKTFYSEARELAKKRSYPEIIEEPGERNEKMRSLMEHKTKLKRRIAGLGTAKRKEGRKHTSKRAKK
jgi:hypothetical protein